MWWFFGGLAALLYIVLIITLGMATLRNGRYVMFIAGIFLPIFWIIGAIMRPTRTASQQPGAAGLIVRLLISCKPECRQAIPSGSPRAAKGRIDEGRTGGLSALLRR